HLAMTTRVPTALELPGSARHLPEIEEITGPAGSTHCWRALPVQVPTVIRLPLPPPGAVRHLLLAGLASWPPARSAHHWLAVDAHARRTTEPPATARHRPWMRSWPAPPGLPAGW